MKPFSRKIEKILAWIANVIMIFVTGLLSLGAFSSQLATAFKQQEFEPILYNLLQDPGVASLLKSTDLDIVSLLVLLVKIYTVVAIVALVLALIASFTNYWSNDSRYTTSCIPTILHSGNYVIRKKTT